MLKNVPESSLAGPIQRALDPALERRLRVLDALRGREDHGAHRDVPRDYPRHPVEDHDVRHGSEEGGVHLGKSNFDLGMVIKDPQALRGLFSVVSKPIFTSV